MREELSQILLLEVADPRLSGISITDVKVDRELTFADVYFSSLEGSERAEEILDGLEHAQGFLRRSLADRVELRIFPKLRFHYDPTFERAERIERLFKSLHESEQTKNSDSPQPGQRSADDK